MAAAALCGVVPVLTGCQSLGLNAADVASVRFVATANAAPGVDFYFGASPLAYNVGFGTVTSYAVVNPGSYLIHAMQTGTHTALAKASSQLTAGKSYTVLVGRSAAGTGLGETVLTDQTTPAPVGQIAVRVLDEAANAGAADVYLVPFGASVAATPVLASGLNFGGSTGYVDVPANTYALVVVSAGKAPGGGTATLLTGSSVSYLTGSVRTLVLLDAAEGGVQAVSGADYTPASGGGLPQS